MWCDHGRMCLEQEVNLQLHLLHLSEENDFQNEWMFVESRPIQPDEHEVCPVVRHRYTLTSLWKTKPMATVPSSVPRVLETLIPKQAL